MNLKELNMKQLIAVQSADGKRLEEVNPYEEDVTSNGRFLYKSIMYSDFEESKQSFLTDDPDVKVGEIVNAEDWEKIWQVHPAKQRFVFTI